MIDIVRQGIIYMEQIILLGIGGHAHSVIDSIESSSPYCVWGFLDVEERVGEKYREYEVLGTDDLLKECYEKGVRNAFVSIGYLGKGEVRNKLYKRLKKIGFSVPNIIDKTAVISKDISLEEGIFIGKKAVINSSVKIGKMSIINTGAIIEHDCEVGEYSHISVGSILCGNVSVGKHSFIGANATVIQGKKIGQHCIIGAGETIRKNVEDNSMIWGERKW